MKVAAPLPKNVLAPLGLTAAASATDAGIQKKIHGSVTTTLVISIEEMHDIMKVVQTLEDSNTFLKGFTKTIKSETKEQKGRFLGTTVGTIGSILLGNVLSGKGIAGASSENKKSKKNCKSWLRKRMGFLIRPYPLTNFEIQKYKLRLDLTLFIPETICLKR